MQAANDTDFEIEVKFDSLVLERYQMQGILVEQDEQNYLRFEFYGDGQNVHLFAASHLRFSFCTFGFRYRGCEYTILFACKTAGRSVEPFRIRWMGRTGAQLAVTSNRSWLQK
jgi:hypothetical protein